MGYIIEFKCGDVWQHSGNRVSTIKGLGNIGHGTYVFPTLLSAQKEIDAQTDDFVYRISSYVDPKAKGEPMNISPLFESKQYNKEGLDNAEKIAKAFTTLFNELSDILPCGREFSIVQTKLEEASFFAKKALGTSEVNTKKAHKFVVEFLLRKSQRWVPSGNPPLTVEVASDVYLDSYEFSSFGAAQAEADAQAKGNSMLYRAVEVK